ncbi:MAG: hemolysin family protein [Chloroflexota bacterium]
MTLSNIFYLVTIFICIALSAFFSASETAFMSVQKIRLQNMIERNVKGAKRVAKILERPERFISTVLLGDTLANTAAVVLATTLAVAFLGETRGAFVTTFGLTIVVLIFGQSIPKTLAARRNEKISIIFSRPIEMLSILFTPFVVALSWISSSLTRMAGGTPVARSITSVEEIRTMITVGRRDGVVEQEEAEMLRNVFEFSDHPVRDIMVPRLDVVAIEQGSKISDFFVIYAKEPLSQTPVYKDSMDNVVGIISDRDVLVGIAKGEITGDNLVDDLMHPPQFTPDSKPIGKLFADMRERNYRLAIVVDEYGGTAGIVSFYRMAEEVMGEVKDGLSDNDFEVINEYTFQVDGSMHIDDVNEVMGTDLPLGDYDTIAGFVLSLLGHIPKQGEQMRYKNLKMVITQMRGTKIEEILITTEEHAAPAH